MTKISVFNQDIDTSLSNNADPFLNRETIAVPYTTIVNREYVTDFSRDLSPRLGVERFHFLDLVEIKGEYGPNGERVFKQSYDKQNAVRAVGNFSFVNNANGTHWQSNSTVTDFVEIVFYGTGLNILAANSDGTRDARATVDGASEGSNFMPTASISTLIQGRNYPKNEVINVVNGLTLGLHTVKIRNQSWLRISGYEVLNTTSTLQLVPGTSFKGSKRLYKSALSTAAYDSVFESGSLGTKGGHVVVYQKPDGTIAKAVTATNATQTVLPSVTRVNEVEVVRFNWRDFGTSRTDDFSSLTTSASNRAYTLDDGMTTLVGNSISQFTSSGFDTLNLQGAGSFVSITFVGTGLDWIEIANGTLDTHNVTLDGAAIGSISGANTTGLRKIVSGLPYGTHTIRVTRPAASSNSLLLTHFIVYAPTKPAIPSGAVELASYYIMATYANDTASPVVSTDSNSTGVLRKSCLREFLYTGASWLLDTFSTAYKSGFGAYNSAATTDYVEYTFIGTGFNLNSTGGTGGGATSWTLSLNGPANTNWSSYTTSILVGGTAATWVNTTGVLSIPINASRFKLCVSGLPFGKQTVRLTKTSGAFASYFEGFDIITPIHAPRYDDFNRLIGSCATLGLLNQFPKEIDGSNVPLATLAGAQGAYKAGKAPGVTNGDAIAAGYIGEIKYATYTVGSISNGSNLSGNGITLTSGLWSVSVYFMVGNTAPTNFIGFISTSVGGAAASSPVTGITTTRRFIDAGNTSSEGTVESAHNLWNVNGSAQLYPTVNISTPVSSTYIVYWSIWAVRIA
jgi:hypothetical protein